MVPCSGRASDDCDRFRVFCIEPRIPSLLKVDVRAVLAELGDFKAEPLAVFADCDCTSMVKFSLFGSGYDRPELLVPPMERGESPVDDGDILLFCRLTAVKVAVARFKVLRISGWVGVTVTMCRGV